MAVSKFHIATKGFKPSGTVDRFHKAVFGLWQETGVTAIVYRIIYLAKNTRNLYLKK